MTITFYTFSCEETQLDKSSYLSTAHPLTGELREPLDVVNPIITFTWTTCPMIITDSVVNPPYNYCYIAVLNRWYFITGCTAISEKYFEMRLHEDVLHSFKGSIVNCRGYVDRCENTTYINRLIPDGMRAQEAGVNVSEVSIGSFGYDYTVFATIYKKASVNPHFQSDPRAPELGRSMNIYAMNQIAFADLVDSMYGWTFVSLFGEKLRDYVGGIHVINMAVGSSQGDSATTVEYAGNSTTCFTSAQSTAYRMKRRYLEKSFTPVYVESPQQLSYLDFPPYTKWTIYLPYYGFADIDPNYFYDGTTARKIGVAYVVDLSTGDCLITVNSVDGNNVSRKIYEFSTTMGKSVNVLQSDDLQKARNLFTTALSAAPAFAMGSPSVVPSLVGMGIQALSPPAVQSFGSENAGTGIMGSNSVVMRITKATTVSTSSYSDQYGEPSGRRLYVRDLSGFAKYADIDLSGVPATAEERDEIHNILCTGFHC